MLKDIADKKKCTRCRKYKSAVDGFYRKSNGALRSECKQCAVERNAPKDEAERRARAAYCKQWREKNRERHNAQRVEYCARNREKIRARHREWHRLFPERKMFNQAKTRAKYRGLAFEIDLSDLLPLPDKCPVLGIPLRKGVGSNDPNSYSLDRIDNSKGYVRGNVIVMSRRANVLKRDATIEELRALALWAESALA